MDDTYELHSGRYRYKTRIGGLVLAGYMGTVSENETPRIVYPVYDMLDSCRGLCYILPPYEEREEKRGRFSYDFVYWNVGATPEEFDRMKAAGELTEVPGVQRAIPEYVLWVDLWEHSGELRVNYDPQDVARRVMCAVKRAEVPGDKLDLARLLSMPW